MGLRRCRRSPEVVRHNPVVAEHIVVAPRIAAERIVVVACIVAERNVVVGVELVAECIAGHIAAAHIVDAAARRLAAARIDGAAVDAVSEHFVRVVLQPG